MINFSRISYNSIAGKILRLPFKLIPKDAKFYILQGRLRGRKWIVGSYLHSCWLGNYEYTQQSFFSKIVREGTVVYDIGANVGFYTLLASVLVGPRGRVFAFEPLPRNIYYLKKHVTINQCDNVTVIEAAVAEADGVTFFEERALGSVGRLSSKGEFKVKKIALDNLIFNNKVPPPNYIKIDAEGAELLILYGAKNTLIKYNPVIFLSIHDDDLYNRCSAFLKSINYDLQPMDINNARELLVFHKGKGYVESLKLSKAVKNYWEEETCGSRYGISKDKANWFQEIEQSRYNLEPYIPYFANFQEYRGRRILEIGIGAGTDYVNWIRNQAHAVGIDFSEPSIKLVQQRLLLEGVDSNSFSLCLADAESLPFKDNAFELVYAWGVLHHTANTEVAIREIQRVLKPSGTIKAMLYHIPSWTGWMLWFRFCFLKLKPWLSPRKAIFMYLESPGTKAYTLPEAKILFENAQFQEIKTETVLGPGDLLLIRPSKRYRSLIYKIIWLVYPRWLVRLLGNRFGLELLLQAKK